MKYKFTFLLIIFATNNLFAESQTSEAKHNYLDLKLGAAQIEKKAEPLGSLSYERIIADSFLIGLSAQYIRLQNEKEQKFFRGMDSSESSLATATLSLGYQYNLSQSWKPFVRIFGGGGQAKGNRQEADVWQYGLAIGTRFFFSESIYLNLELAGSRFELREERSKTTDVPQLTLGIGYSF